MLRSLKKLVKSYGIIKITADLGCRSPTTINNWIKDDRIPDLAITKVKNYLKSLRFKK